MTVEALPPSSPTAAVNAAADRWRPSRAGLVNVWQFDDEILEFERGRLVLFGPNGSGKTMALELLLPYLLDAHAQPGRLSTSGADRGGLWDRVTGYDSGVGRTAYLWLEFLRPGGHAFTIGVRLRAKPSSGGDKHWFTTNTRIGHDLHLLDDRRRPLSVEQLKEALRGNGHLWGTDTDGYRNAVRSTLFPGWTAARVEALIATLLVVRKQHVTDGLSPKVLSAHLSEALPPLDHNELSRVADGFADLDRRRDHIAQLDEDMATTRKLVRTNREYARAVVGRATTALAQAQTAVDNVTRRVRELTETQAGLLHRGDELRTQAESLEDEGVDLDARLQVLHASGAYQQGGQLNLLREQARSARESAETANKDAAGEEDNAQKLQRAAQTDERNAETAAQQARSARIELEQSAALLGAEFMELRDESVAAGCEEWIDARHKAVGDVRVALQHHAQAVDHRIARERDRDQCEEALTESESLLAQERKTAEEVMVMWETNVTGWRSATTELEPYLVTSPLDELAEAPQAVAEARRCAELPIVEQRSRFARAEEDLVRELAGARTERDEWAAGRDPEPAVPHGRRDRSGLPGQCFWRLVQFQEHIEVDVRGNIEATLSDARLLDAWVAPDGALALADDDADIVMQFPQPLAAGPTLADLLEPDPASDAVPHGHIDALLRSIVLVAVNAHEGEPGPRPVVGRDGTWRTHRLAARAAPGPARFIGTSSRAAARAVKIAELDEQIATLELSRAKVEAQQSELDRRLTVCETEHDTFPSPDDAMKANRAVEMGEVRTQHKAMALTAATEQLTQASGLVQERLRVLSTVATHNELPTDVKKLDQITTALRELTRQVSAFERRRERSISTKDRASATRMRADEARDRAHAQRARARTRVREANSIGAQLEELDRAIGADYRDIIQRIEQIKDRRGEIRGEASKNAAEQNVLARELGSINSRLSSAEQERAKTEKDRSDASQRFIAATQDGLLTAAEVPDPPVASELPTFTATLEAARRIRSWQKSRADVDDAGLQRLSNNLARQVSDAEGQLMGRADLTFETTDYGWSVVRTRRDGLPGSTQDLRDSLRNDLQSARAELTNKQQELFEQILSGSVREHLRERLWAAQALVDRINKILGIVRTDAGGVTVRLQWEIDPNLDDAAELRRAKDLLLRDSPLAEGRKDLDAFLQGRIERIRSAENDTGQWRDRLAEMLNYRAWHRFRVMVHHKRFGDRPRALESRKVSLSAGEKTIVMVLPLLAAVTSHYEPAPGDPPSITPRLLLMDELFPKVDYPNKRQLLGLLPTLDLDAVFTSDKDRCEYDTVDGIAIHVFQKLADDSSTTTRLVWNGAGLRVADTAVEGTAASPME